LTADFIEQRKLLKVEGYLVATGKTGQAQIENPRSRVCQNTASTINAMGRRLGISEATRSDRRTTKAHAKAERAHRKPSALPTGRVSDDDLLN
jgi:hypothetical protein